MEKQYRTSVRTDADYDEIPEVVQFTIDDLTAREIVRLAALVKANGLYKVEKFDYRARYLKNDLEETPEEAAAEGEDNEVRTDSDCLNVSETEFWFSAYLKHCDVEILGERQRISELIEFFGLSVETESTSHEDKNQKFVDQVANLCIWDFDRDDGTPYQECEAPSDGYLDSHCCLMQSIEEARRVQGGK